MDDAPELDETAFARLMERLPMEDLRKLKDVMDAMSAVLKECNAVALAGGKPDPQKLEEFHKLSAEFQRIVQQLGVAGEPDA